MVSNFLSPQFNNFNDSLDLEFFVSNPLATAVSLLLPTFIDDANEYFSNSMSKYVGIDTPVKHLTGKFGEISAGPGIDQDVSVWQSQQQGLVSRGFKGDYMAYQERRIRFHHETIDRYIDNSLQSFIKKNS